MASCKPKMVEKPWSKNTSTRIGLHAKLLPDISTWMMRRPLWVSERIVSRQKRETSYNRRGSSEPRKL